MHRNTLFPLCFLVPILLLAGCSGNEAPQGGHGVPVRAATLQLRDIAYPQEYVGKTAGSREIDVRARVDGILLRRAYVEGAYVEEDDLLFEIEPESSRALVTQAQGELQRLRADLEMARLNRDRMVKLFGSGVVSAQERDDAVTTYNAALASVQAAEGRVDEVGITLGYTQVRAPISGITSMEVSSEGTLVRTGQDSGLLTTITQLDPIYVNFSIASTLDLKLRRLAERGLLETPEEGYLVRMVLSDGSEYGRPGFINFRDRHVDATTGAIRHRAEFRNPDAELIPGEIVRVRLEGAVLRQVLAVPQRAVLFTQSGPMVFVLDDEDRAAMRPVELSDPIDGMYVVFSGLEPGQRIVTEGIIKVRDGAPVTVLPDAPPPAGDEQQAQAEQDAAAIEADAASDEVQGEAQADLPDAAQAQ